MSGEKDRNCGFFFADLEKAGAAALPMVPQNLRALLQEDLRSLRDVRGANDTVAGQRAAAGIAARIAPMQPR